MCDAKRSRYFLWLFLCLLALTRVGFAEEKISEKKLSLKEAITLALRHNRTVEQAYLNRVIEKFNLVVSKREFSPDFNLSSSVTKNTNNGVHSTTVDVKTTAAMKVKTGGNFSAAWTQSALDPWNIPANGANSSFALSFNQPLLKGFGLKLNQLTQAIASRNEEQNILRLRSTLMNIVTQVVIGYRNFALAHQSLEISKNSLQRAKYLLQQQEALMKSGRVAELDVIQAKSSYTRQQLSLRRSINSLDNTRVTLLQLLNIDYHLMITPDVSFDIKDIEFDTKQLQDLAQRKQPNFLSTLLTLENAASRATLEKDNNQWDLNLNTTYFVAGTSNRLGASQPRLGSMNHGDYAISLQLLIPINDYNLKQRELSAQISQEKINLDVQQNIDNLNLDVANAVRDIKLLWDEIALAKESSSLTKQQLEAEMTLLSFNRSDRFKIRRAEDDLIAAENNELRTKMGYLNALTQLDLLIGTTLERWGIDIEQQQGEK